MKMNSPLSIKTLLYISEPLIVKIIEDIVISHPIDKCMGEAKITLYQRLTKLTGKTHFYFDRDVLVTVRDIISDSDKFYNHGYILLEAVEAWISPGKTHWDVFQIMSVVDIFKLATKAIVPAIDVNVGDMPNSVAAHWYQQYVDQCIGKN